MSKRLAQVGLLLLVSLVLLPLNALKASSLDRCLMLVEGSGLFLNSHAEDLHAVLDLLPAELELGLALVGSPSSRLEPAPLSRARRAELHAYLAQGDSTLPAVESVDWQTAIDVAIDLTHGWGNSKSTIMVIHSGSTLPADWGDLVQQLAEHGVLLYELDLSAPQIRENPTTEQRSTDRLTKAGLARVPELLGLTMAELTGLAFSDLGIRLELTVPAGITSLILQWDPLVTQHLALTTPTGALVDLESTLLQAQLFWGHDYTCLHLTPDLLPELSDWQGQWKLTASSAVSLGVWFNDPAWLQADVREIRGQRIVSLATNLNETGAQTAGMTTVFLQDWRGHNLIQLNDQGLNGDAVASDGIYSAVLPGYVHAGPAVIKTDGSSERSQTIYIPAASPQPLLAANSSESVPTYKLLVLGAGLAISGLGLLHGKGKPPPVWRVSQLGLDGHWRGYDLTSETCLVGSRADCQIRLARTAAPVQLRLRQMETDVLRLDLLSEEPAVCVNDQQVYLSCFLQHADRVTIAGEILVVERIGCLRIGKHSA